MRKLLLVLIVLAVLGVWVAVSPVYAEKVFKVGVLGPFTGAQAKVGAEFKASVDLALEEIGYKIGDYKVEPVWIDSQMDPAKAVGAYEEAIEAKNITAGVLNWQSSVAVAVMDVVAKHKVPHIFGFGATGLVNEKYHSDREKYEYWSCKGWPVPAKLMKGYVSCIEESIEKGDWQPEKKVAAIYGEDTDWGRNAGSALKTLFEEAGWQVISEDYFPVNQSDFYPLLGKYRKQGVALLAGTCNYPAMGALIKQSREVGIKAAMIADGLGWVGNWYEMSGAGSNGVIDMIPLLATSEAKAWAKTVEEKFGFKPSPSSGGLSYDGFRFFIKIARRALEKHGELTRESMFEVIRSEVNTGQLSFTREDGAIIMTSYTYTADSAPDPLLGREGYFFPVIQYENGVGHVVYPEVIKERDFIPPK